MFKRIISFIVSAVIGISFTIAYSFEEKTYVNVSVNISDVNITATSNKSGVCTLKVYKLEYDSDVAQYKISGAPVTVDEAKSEAYIGVEYIYNFNKFTFPDNTETGKYRAIVNNTYIKDFDFISRKTKIEFYINLAQASADEIENLLETNKNTVNLGIDEYFEYTPEEKLKFNECVADLDLPQLSLEPQSDLTEVQAFEKVLTEELNRLFVVRAFSKADDNFANFVEENKNKLLLDLKYYNDTVLKLDKKLVCDKMKLVGFPSYSKDAVKESFDIAVLLAIINSANNGYVTSALEYYDGKCIELTDESLTSTQKNTVSQYLRTNADNIKNVSDIKEYYEKGVEKVKEASDRTPAGSGGGGGSSKGTMVSPVKHEDKTEDIVKTSFNDLHKTEWARTAVEYLAQKGAVSGRGDGGFYPNDNVTREEFVKIVVEAFGLLKTGESMAFNDVENGRWSYDCIASAVRAGIVSGVSETEFMPTANITRQDMVVIAYRLAQIMKIEFKENTVEFSDNNTISDYAMEAVSVLANSGVINGVGNNMFAPFDNVTRAQAAKICYELMIYEE